MDLKVTMKSGNVYLNTNINPNLYCDVKTRQETVEGILNSKILDIMGDSTINLNVSHIESIEFVSSKL